MLSTKYLIIGGSAAGVSAANQLARLEPDANILCVTAEQAKPYNKCFLVDWIAREKSEQEVYLSTNSQIKFMHGAKVTRLDAMQKIAYLDDGKQVKYEKTLLCIGVSAFVPPISGINDHKNVFSFHDFADAQKILNFVEQQNAKRAVVIGAGLTGLECADALARLGLQVSVVERADQVLSKHVDKVGAQKIEGLMRDFGVDFYGDQEVIGIDDNTVQLKSGKILPADMIVVAVGVRPNKIEVKSGEFEGLGGYLKVDECLLTNLPDVWAAGDMIVAPDILTGQLSPSCSWPDAMMQGNIAAQNMVGRERKYPGILSIANSHFFGQDFISCGNLEGENSLQGDFASSYQKCITDGDGLVSGFVLVGDISKYPALRRAILTKQPII